MAHEIDLLASHEITNTHDTLANAVDRVRETHQPLLVEQAGEPVAVVVDIESWNDMTFEARLAHEVERGMKDIVEGRIYPHEQVKEQFSKNFARGMR